MFSTTQDAAAVWRELETIDAMSTIMACKDTFELGTVRTRDTNFHRRAAATAVDGAVCKFRTIGRVCHSKYRNVFDERRASVGLGSNFQGSVTPNSHVPVVWRKCNTVHLPWYARVPKTLTALHTPHYHKPACLVCRGH